MSEWVRIVSWHLSAGWTSRGGLPKTLCGRWAAKDAPQADELPADEKSCESCLRIRERKGDG